MNTIKIIIAYFVCFVACYGFVWCADYAKKSKHARDNELLSYRRIMKRYR